MKQCNLRNTFATSSAYLDMTFQEKDARKGLKLNLFLLCLGGKGAVLEISLFVRWYHKVKEAAFLPAAGCPSLPGFTSNVWLCGISFSSFYPAFP